MDTKVAVLGDNDFVMPFSTLGLDTYGVEQNEDAIIDAAQQIASEQYGLVVIAENVAPAADKVFKEIENKPLPAIVVVPFTSESKGFALKSLGELLKMSMGIDIIN